MSRLQMPAAIQDAPAVSQPLLETVSRRLGRLPNVFRVMASSPAALQAYLGLADGLGGGMLDGPMRERIALAVSEINGCDYCLSARTYSGRMAKLDDTEITANRNGSSNDPKAEAAVRFAAQLVRRRGHVSDADIAAVRSAGYDDGQIIEITALSVLATLTNYINEVAGTDIDFPLINARKAA